MTVNNSGCETYDISPLEAFTAFGGSNPFACSIFSGVFQPNASTGDKLATALSRRRPDLRFPPFPLRGLFDLLELPVSNIESLKPIYSPWTGGETDCKNEDSQCSLLVELEIA
jgi:hypothetical protein